MTLQTLAKFCCFFVKFFLSFLLYTNNHQISQSNINSQKLLLLLLQFVLFWNFQLVQWKLLVPCQAGNTKHFLINLNHKINGRFIHQFIITILSLSSSIEMSKLPNSLSDPAKNSRIRMSIKVFSHFNQINQIKTHQW